MYRQEQENESYEGEDETDGRRGCHRDNSSAISAAKPKIIKPACSARQETIEGDYKAEEDNESHEHAAEGSVRPSLGRLQM